MNDLLLEAAKAIIWVSVGVVPTMLGFGIVIWSDVKSLKKGSNAAFSKIRDLESRLPEVEKCTGKERKNR